MNSDVFFAFSDMRVLFPQVGAIRTRGAALESGSAAPIGCAARASWRRSGAARARFISRLLGHSRLLCKFRGFSLMAR
jgi:hypothetical protein